MGSGLLWGPEGGDDSTWRRYQAPLDCCSPYFKKKNNLLFSFLATPQHRELLGQGSDPDSLSHCAWLGIDPESWHGRDATNPRCAQRELPLRRKVVLLMVCEFYPEKQFPGPPGSPIPGRWKDREKGRLCFPPLRPPQAPGCPELHKASLETAPIPSLPGSHTPPLLAECRPRRQGRGVRGT